MKRVLIANRGEIALRVIRACRDLDLSPVVVFSDADRDSLPVRLADAAFPIGAAPASQSYLDGDAIIAAARRAGADAVHPGYGFLAENAAFASACAAARLTFVGPSPGAMRLVGDKVEARRLMKKRGVPVIPGLTERAADLDTVRGFARRTGYPVILKAAAGGGGKGMRVVRSEAEMEGAFRAARSEAKSAFGDDGVYAEKFLERVRHIEIQILADGRGRVIHLGERECSVQRRHQKLIEESPSTAVGAALRARMGRLAIEVARASRYRNAGTVEFLLDEEGKPHFMEVNARIQVEHPVTEMVTGVDLVRAQLEIAAGRSLPLTQAAVRPRGWAIECRIVAEDPGNGFRPCPGRVTALRLPAGPGVRVETALQSGEEISLYYDPMVAKLIVWGRDRAEAIARMRRALDEFVVVGIRTTLPFHREVMTDAEFLAGRIDIGWCDRNLPRLSEALRRPGPDEEAAVIAAAVTARTAGGVRRPGGERAAAANAWALEGRRAQMQGRSPAKDPAAGARRSWRARS